MTSALHSKQKCKIPQKRALSEAGAGGRGEEAGPTQDSDFPGFFTQQKRDVANSHVCHILKRGVGREEGEESWVNKNLYVTIIKTGLSVINKIYLYLSYICYVIN